MIDPHLFLAFVAAVTVLMLIPGPNVALIVANSVSFGARYGLVTVAGTTSAMVIQLAFTGLGLAPAMSRMGGWFELLRWAGVVYLLYLGISQWRAAATGLSAIKPETAPLGAMVRRAFLVSLTNPKTLFFYAAFFPQFIDRSRDTGLQLAILSLTFLIIAWIVDGCWALLAARARALLSGRERLRNRVSGGLLIGASLGLAAARAK